MFPKVIRWRQAAENRPLQPSLRQVFLLREHGGVSFKEIAAMTGAPLGTVLWRMSAALKHLRKELEADGVTAK